MYDRLDPFAIQNDRMAELLLPLQAVATVECSTHLATLRAYAESLDERDRERELMSPGVMLLLACREIFAKALTVRGDGKFLPTRSLIARLVQRSEEPWGRFTRGEQITPEALANLLRPFGIQSRRNKDQSARGSRRRWANS